MVDGADEQFRRQIIGLEFVSSDSDVVGVVADAADVVADVGAFIGSDVNGSNQW